MRSRVDFSLNVGEKAYIGAIRPPLRLVNDVLTL